MNITVRINPYSFFDRFIPEGPLRKEGAFGLRYLFDKLVFSGEGAAPRSFAPLVKGSEAATR